MEFVKKIVPVLLIAIVFAVVGYFIGKGAMQDQQAAFYRATANLNTMKAVSTDPCTMNPTIPCTPSGAEVNRTCPEGSEAIQSKCVPVNLEVKITGTGSNAYISKSSFETVAGVMSITQGDWEKRCAKMWGGTGVLNSNNGCVKGTINTAPTTTKAQ